MRSRDVEVDMIVNLPVRVMRPWRSNVEVALPGSYGDLQCDYEDIEPRYTLDDTITLPSGTEISITAALGDLARTREYLAEQYDRSQGNDQEANALLADVEYVRELLSLLAAPA